jgi:MFS family permease
MTFMARFYPIVIGPIVGGFVAENPKLGWHFNFWISLMFSVLTLVVGFFYTPETVRT